MKTCFAALSLAVWVGCSTPAAPLFQDAGPTDLGVDVRLAPTGSACTVNDDGEPLAGCSRGQYCLRPEEGFPNGYCAADCRTVPCPTGEVCFPERATRHFCLRPCASDEACRVEDGYVCRAWRPGAPPTCLPNTEPLGRRQGRACFATDEDAGPGPYLAPLPTGVFGEAAVALTRDRFPSVAEAEPSLAVGPDTMAAGFMALDARGVVRGGVAQLSGAGALVGFAELRDGDYPDVLYPSLGFDRAGQLFAAFVANNLDTPGNALRVATSLDRGATFARPRPVLAGTACVQGCDLPALAVGPDVDGRTALVVAVLMGQRDGSRSLVVVRSLDAGATFEAPITLASLEITARTRRAPAMVALSSGPAPGEVSAVWIDQNRDNALAPLGDAVNRVRLRRSVDGGRTWAPLEEVARTGDSPVATMPGVASGGGRLHVVYVHGGLLGAWDVVLATRMRDGVWQHRVVNDDPDRCATHGYAALSVDPTRGDADVVWLENRFGPGAVAYARCPADAGERCGRNERVSAVPFALSTSADPLRGHGLRSALVRDAEGDLWAAWSDTRTGGPGLYLAHGRPSSR